MSSLTSRLSLYKPASDGSEFYNVVTDLLNNLDKIDAAIGATAVTSSTRPASAYNGQWIRETDTGRVYVSNGTLPGSASFTTQPFVVGVAAVSASASRALKIRTTGDTFDRAFLSTNAQLWFGDGTSADVDTNLYRSAANTLKTDDSLIVNGDLSVLGVGQEFFAEVSTNRSMVTNTPVNDTELVFQMAANAVYYVEVILNAQGTAGDLLTSWVVPTGATGLKHCLGPALASTDRADTQVRSSGHAFITSVSYGVNSSSGASVREQGVVHTTNAGQWNLVRSQNSTNAAATIVEAFSFVRIKRVA